MPFAVQEHADSVLRDLLPERSASTGLTDRLRDERGCNWLTERLLRGMQATEARVGTSHATVANSSLRMSVAAPTEQSRPTAMPMMDSLAASRMTRLCTALRGDPNAMRTPISRVR